MRTLQRKNKGKLKKRLFDEIKKDMEILGVTLMNSKYKVKWNIRIRDDPK